MILEITDTEFFEIRLAIGACCSTGRNFLFAGCTRARLFPPASLNECAHPRTRIPPALVVARTGTPTSPARITLQGLPHPHVLSLANGPAVAHLRLLVCVCLVDADANIMAPICSSPPSLPPPPSAPALLPPSPSAPATPCDDVMARTDVASDPAYEWCWNIPVAGCLQ